MMLFSIQSSAGPYEICPEDGLPASIDNSKIFLAILEILDGAVGCAKNAEEKICFFIFYLIIS